MTASDGINTTTQEITINVSNVNDIAPEFTSDATFSAAENQTAVGTVLTTDADGDDLTFTISGSDITIIGSSSAEENGNWPALLEFVSPPDYETQTSYSATVTVSDGAFSTSQEITVNITNVNDIAPVITSESTFSAAETSKSTIGTVTATDQEGDTIIFTVSGDELAISSSGELTFVSAPDYETKASYSATVTASDSINFSTQDITITITNVNDVAPVITSESTFSAAENQTTIGTVTATDEEGDDITFSISGDELAISSAGVLSFVSAPDYESKSTYTATVTASDGVNLTTQNITVTIIDVFEDSDGDGISDSEEIRIGTDPLNDDTDFDSLPDGWEVDNQRDPLLADYKFFRDTDGLPIVCFYGDEKFSCSVENELLNYGQYDTLAQPPEGIDIGQVVDFDVSGETACLIHEVEDINQLFCWHIYNGQGSDLSKNIPTIENPQTVDVSFHVACASDINNKLICWGQDYIPSTDRPTIVTSYPTGDPIIVDEYFVLSDEYLCYLKDTQLSCFGTYQNSEYPLPSINLGIIHLDLKHLSYCVVTNETSDCTGQFVSQSVSDLIEINDLPNIRDLTNSRYGWCLILDDKNTCHNNYGYGPPSYENLSHMGWGDLNGCVLFNDGFVSCYGGDYAPDLDQWNISIILTAMAIQITPDQMNFLLIPLNGEIMMAMALEIMLIMMTIMTISLMTKIGQ